MGWIVRGPSGGMAWHYLNFVGSLLELGHDAFFIEDSSGQPCFDWTFERGGTDPAAGLAFASHAFNELGLGDRWAYYDEHDNAWKGARAADAVDLCSSADVVINISGKNVLRHWFDAVSTRIYIDTDPGFTQIRNLTEPASRRLCAEHTAFFTFGENIGHQGCSVPADGFDWQPTRQPIWLSAWPYSSDRSPGRFTTVMQWDSYQPYSYGQLHLRMKSASFQRFDELPNHTACDFDIAVGRPFPRQELSAKGWNILDLHSVVRDPLAYRRFIQTSGAEIGIAKEGYVVTRCGWFSERSAAYLASGCPVLHQQTGFAAHLPTDRGLLGCDNLDEAVEGVRRIQSAYDQHSRAARDLAEAYFSPQQVLPSLLESAGGIIEATGPGRIMQAHAPLGQATSDATTAGRTTLAISAVVCTFMRYDLLKKAVESLRRQTLEMSSFEILVIDNSPDAEISQRASLDYVAVPNLRWIYEPKSGEANARNVAVAHANSPIVAFLDDDATACPGWLDAILSAFASGDDVAAVGGRVNPVWAVPRPPWLADDLLGYLSVLDWGDRLRPIEWGEWLIAANLAFRVSAVKEAGGFQTHLGRRSGEQVLMSNCEMDVIDVLRGKGYRALYNPAASIDHLIHPQRLTQTWMRRRVVWQAISNYLMDPGGQSRQAPAIRDSVVKLLRQGARSLTQEIDDPAGFGQQFELLRDLTAAMLTGFEAGDPAGAAAPPEEIVVGLPGPAGVALSGAARDAAATPAGAAEAAAPVAGVQLLRVYGDSFLELYARRSGLFVVREAPADLDPQTPIALVIGADVPEDIDVFLPKVLADGHLRGLLRSRAVLVLDGSGEGPGFSPRVAEQLHARLAAAEIDPRRVVFLTQNHQYRADYTDWRSRNGIETGIVIHLYHYYMRETVRIISTMTDRLLASAHRRISGAAPAPSRRYACLNNKARGHRAIVLGWLSRHNLLGQGHVSFLAGDSDNPTFALDTALGEASEMFAAFGDDLSAFRELWQNGPLSISGDNREAHLTFGLDAQLWLHEDSWLSLVTETEMTSSGQIRRFTEKSLKPLAFGHPMIVLGYPGALSLLRSYGFRTFYPVIDESYDEVVDPQKRLQLALGEFARLAALPEPAMAAVRERLADTLIYNVGVFERHLPEALAREDAWLGWLLQAMARGVGPVASPIPAEAGPREEPVPAAPAPAASADSSGFNEPETAVLLRNLGGLPVPHHVFLARGTLVPAEQRLLYALACQHYSGAGAIVDAGAFCGAAAYALAAGLSDNPGDFPKQRRIHSYDLFAAQDDSTRSYLQNNFYSRFDEYGNRVEVNREVAPDEPFLDIFTFQTQRYEKLIQVHPGSIVGQTWSAGPIEILCIAVCSALELQAQVLHRFLPQLVPGRSLLIQQDFHDARHLHVAVVMEYLDPYFDIALSAVGGSRVYRLRRPLPPQVLERAANYEFTDEEIVELLERTVQKAAPAERPALSAALARELFLQGQAERCRGLIDSVLSDLEAPDKARFEALFAELCPDIYRPAANAA